jgi:hypothetical protein
VAHRRQWCAKGRAVSSLLLAASAQSPLLRQWRTAFPLLRKPCGMEKYIHRVFDASSIPRIDPVASYWINED